MPGNVGNRRSIKTRIRGGGMALVTQRVGVQKSRCATFDGVPGLMVSVIGPQASRHGI